MLHMKLERLDDLFEYVQFTEKRTLVAVNATDSQTLEAIAEAVSMNMISAVVTGNRDEIINQCVASHIDDRLFQIIFAASLTGELETWVSGHCLGD